MSEKHRLMREAVVLGFVCLIAVPNVRAAAPFRLAADEMPAICIEGGLRPFVSRAADDLASDLAKVFGVRAASGSCRCG